MFKLKKTRTRLEAFHATCTFNSPKGGLNGIEKITTYFVRETSVSRDNIPPGSIHREN